MTFSFNSALSGLNANSKALNVTGNNIANANTVGFRSSSVTFEDVFAERYGVRLNGAGNGLQIGDGVRVGSIHTSFEQGGLNESGSPIQSAIQGNGFFVVKNKDGSNGYTRAGDFSVDNQGNILSSTGGSVQGYQAQNGVISQGSALGNLQIPLGQTLEPKVTTNATMKVNLDSRSKEDSVFHATVQVWDSLGVSRTLDLKFTRKADGTYDMTAQVEGKDAQINVDGGGAGSSPANFKFDADGSLLTPADSLSIVPDSAELDGAELPEIVINLREVNPDGTAGASLITGFAMKSAQSGTKQDGFGAGALDGVAVDPDGNIFGVFSNGQSRIVGQYALATFNANEGLARTGGNMFAETTASGQATIGEPGTGGRGSIAGGYLESSNVNLTEEFVDLIQAQRGFQANSRVITTLNQTFQDLLNIV